MADVLFGEDTVIAIRGGNAIVFKQVFDSCYEGLCRYAFSILRDADEAEDVVQSMFVKLWERRQELDIRHALKSYLFRAVYNQCMNHLDHKSVKSKYQSYSLRNETDVQLPEVFQHELDDKIKRAIDALPNQCRVIFIMSRYEEMKYSEIADKLNLSVNTIQNQVCKALKILREELKEIIV